MTIFMTLDGVVSSIECLNGRVLPIAQCEPAAPVMPGYFVDKPVPTHQNGVK